MEGESPRPVPDSERMFHSNVNGYQACFSFPSNFLDPYDIRMPQPDNRHMYTHPSAVGKLIRSAPSSALLGIRRPLI